MPQDGIGLTLVGGKSLQRTFDALTPAIQKKVLRKGLRAVWKLVLTAVKSAARLISPRLARFMTLRALKRSRQRVGVVISTPKREKLGIAQDAKGYWPAHHEYGTSKMKATPYLRPTVDAWRERVFRLTGVKIRAAIDEVWKKGKR